MRSAHLTLLPAPPSCDQPNLTQLWLDYRGALQRKYNVPALSLLSYPVTHDEDTAPPASLYDPLWQDGAAALSVADVGAASQWPLPHPRSVTVSSVEPVDRAVPEPREPREPAPPASRSSHAEAPVTPPRSPLPTHRNPNASLPSHPPPPPLLASAAGVAELEEAIVRAVGVCRGVDAETADALQARWDGFRAAFARAGQEEPRGVSPSPPPTPPPAQHAAWRVGDAMDAGEGGAGMVEAGMTGPPLQLGGQGASEAEDGAPSLWALAEDGMTPVPVPSQALLPIGPLASQGDWDMMVDPRFSTIYFYNRVTGESIWQEPPGWVR